MNSSVVADFFSRGRLAAALTFINLLAAVALAPAVYFAISSNKPLFAAALSILFCTSLTVSIVAVRLHVLHKDDTAKINTLQEQLELVHEQSISLKSQVEVLAAMREVSRIISDDVDFCRILDQVFRILENLLNPREIVVIAREQDSEEFVPRAVRRQGETIFDDLDAAEAEDPLFAQAVEGSCLKKQVEPGLAMIACPLIVDREVAGAIKFVLDAEGNSETAQKKIDYAELVINDIARHIALAIKTPNLHDRAIIDGLTELYSRTHFENQLKEHTSVARRYHKVLSLIMVDIDLFKRVNDIYGHLAGDVVLSEVASTIKENVRDCDSVYRYGGEEFAVILPETSALQSQMIAERLRNQIAETTFAAGKNSISVTISLGVAEFDYAAERHDDLVARADEALLAAKKRGRNTTFVWFDGPRPVKSPF